MTQTEKLIISSKAPRPLPIIEYSRMRIGVTWSQQDHEYLVHVFNQVDRLATELVEKARRG